MGLVGLGNSWRVAYPLWGYPHAVGQIIHACAIVVWLLLLSLYGLKWLHSPDAARAEMHHGVQGNFVALVPISTMLISLALWHFSQDVASLVFLLGFVGWLLFALWYCGRVFTTGGTTPLITHALYMPWVAGNFTAAIVSNTLGWVGWDQVFFGAGVVSWLVLESVVLQRLLTVDPLPAALRGTLGIQLAPPAVGLVAYLAVTPQPSASVAHMLLGYALLQGLLLLRLLPWICAQGWSMSYWSVSFGGTALAVGAQRWLANGASSSAAWLAEFLFYVANVLVALLLVGSAGDFLRCQRARQLKSGTTP
jgi:tellurite resistance protein